MAISYPYIVLPETEIQERAAIRLTTYHRDASDAAATPSTLHYRIDCLSTGTTVLDWTSETPSTSNTLSIKSSENRIIDDSNRRELKQVTVALDKGTIDETRDTVSYHVVNIKKVTI